MQTESNTLELFSAQQVCQQQGSNGVIQFFVPGLPAPAGSKTGFFNKKAGRVMITDACKRTKPWQATVSSFAMETYKGPLLEGPLFLQAIFCMPRPKGHYGTGANLTVVKRSAPAYPTVAPDATKLVRAIEDALTGVIWKDDAQVVMQIVRKVFSEKPGVEIEIREVR